MVEELVLKNFKGINDLRIRDFSRINIFVGRNETGKSSILEGIALGLSVQDDFKDHLQKDILKNYIVQKYRSVKNLISIGQKKAIIDIDGSKILLEISHEENGLMRNGYMQREIISGINEIAKEYSIHQMVRNSRTHFEKDERNHIDEQILENLNQNFVENILNMETVVISGSLDNKLKNVKFFSFEPFRNFFRDQKRITDYMEETDPDFDSMIDIYTDKKVSTPFIFYTSERRTNFKELYDTAVQKKMIKKILNEIKKEIKYFQDLRQSNGKFKILSKDSKTAIPLEVRGDGLKSSIYMMFMENIIKKGVIILEEPENYLHPGLMSSWCKNVLKSSGSNQYFISTHSSELIEYILDNEDIRDDIKIFKLFKDPFDYEAMDGNEAYERMFEMKEDLRGI